MEARKVGVLIGLENHDGLNRPWEFDPLSLRSIVETMPNGSTNLESETARSGARLLSGACRKA